MSRVTRQKRAGVVLLDVLCAMLVLSVAGIGLLSQVAASLHAARAAAEAEERVGRLDQLLRVHALLTAAELRARAGLRAYGSATVEVRPLTSSLFEVTVDGVGGGSLKTVLFAREDVP